MEHMGEGTGKGSPSSDSVSPYEEQEGTGFFALISSSANEAPDIYILSPLLAIWTVGSAREALWKCQVLVLTYF